MTAVGIGSGGDLVDRCQSHCLPMRRPGQALAGRAIFTSDTAQALAKIAPLSRPILTWSETKIASSEWFRFS
ncbi:MAG: hypothetical protein AB3N11_11915, partial [Arenibacterium sp.]